MARTLYDSITAADIPRTAAMVAGYLPPSHFAWSDADWARFPGAVKVRIAIFATVNDGHVLDVEPGDATPAQAPGWVKRRRAAGADPTVYCNASTWPAVRAEFKRQAVAEPHYWIARYDGDPTIPAGAVAKQYADPAKHGAGHFDLSIVADYWPGVDHPKENDMTPAELKAMRLQDGKFDAEFEHTLVRMAQGVERLFTMAPQLAAIQGALTSEEARIIAAIQGLAGGVDVAILADALASKLGPDLGRELVDALVGALEH